MVFKRRILIVLEKIKIPWLFVNHRIYARQSLISKGDKKYTSIDDDMFLAADYRLCDNETSSIETKLFKNIINTDDIKFLSKYGGRYYSESIIKNIILMEGKKIIYLFRYAEKFVVQNNIHDIAYVWSNNASYKMYRELELLNVLPVSIRFHPINLLYLRCRDALKFMYFFFKILPYLEWQLFSGKKLKEYVDNNYQTIVNLDYSLLDASIRENNISDDNVFKLFSKEKDLFMNIRLINQQWEKRLIDLGFNVCVLHEMFSHITFFEYISKYYLQHCSWRLHLILLGLRYPWTMAACYDALVYRVLWELFYHKSTASYVVSMMIKEDITSSVAHKNNEVKSVFTYFSTTEDIVMQRIADDKSACHDYTHMISDYIVSSNISNEWLKTNENRVGEYIPLGPIFSDLVRKYSIRKNEFCRQMNIPDDVKIVSFLDHAFGHNGVLTINAFNAFIEAMLSLSECNKNIYFLFKSKKSLTQICMKTDNISIKLIEKIRSINNAIYVNDYHIDSLKLIGMSDLVVSAPMSSVFFESLCGGVKAISYDPLGQYRDYNVLSLRLKNMSAVSYIQLEHLVKYWLFNVVDHDFEHYLSGHVYSCLGGGCNGASIKQFRSFLEMK